MSRGKPWADSPGADYITGVLDGSIPASESILLCVQRAAEDHAQGHKRGLVYKEEMARRAVGYMGFCRHTVGRWRGQRFEHAPWQAFISGELFGWYMQDSGFRRFNLAMIEIPKKNGKSTYLAALGTYMLVGDGEASAQVLALATKRDQARIVFDEARKMIMNSPELRSRVSIYQHNMHVKETYSKFEPMASDVDTVDGFNPSCQIVDELHRHKSRYLWDLVENATSSRDQPLSIAITTAGDDVQSICYEQHTYALNILNNTFTNDHYFCFIASPDKGYEWENEADWHKVNPSLGITLSLDSVRKTAKKARQTQSGALAFRRYRMNEWVNEVERWIDMAAWRECDRYIELEDLIGQPCYAGLDLALSRDMSAFVMLFEVGDYWVFMPRYYCCEQSVKDRSVQDNIQYDVWADNGFIDVTPGDVTDFAYIKESIKELAETYKIHSIGYDPFMAAQLATELLEHGLNMVEVRQGALTLNQPMQMFLRKILERKLIHNDHPIFSWNAQNVVARENANLGMAPDKKKSVERIDGISAAFMAIHRLLGLGAEDKKKKRSTYEDRMPLVINQ